MAALREGQKDELASLEKKYNDLLNEATRLEEEEQTYEGELKTCSEDLADLNKQAAEMDAKIAR